MSDTSQGHGWWVASDGKWYAPEQHPDYVAPSLPSAPAADGPVKPTGAPNFAAETVAIPAAQPPPAPVPTAPVPTAPSPIAPGPAFTSSGPATQTYNTGISNDPNYNLPAVDEPTSSKRNLILGVGALVLIAGLGFLAFRVFSGGNAGGADSPEAAIDQLIASVNERDAVGFVDVFDPDEIEAWFGSFAPAVAQFEGLDGGGQTTNEITDAYASVFTSFDYAITGPAGEPVTYQVEPLDEKGRITRVRIDGLDFELSVGEVDTSVIFAFGDDPIGIDASEVDGTRAEFRDETRGLASRLFVPGETPLDEFAPDGHIDLVTVQKDGKWYVSMGYTFLEIARSQGEFDGYPRPDFGRAFDLVDSQTGGADSPESVVQELFTSIESLDYETAIELTDPYGTPYLHDYQPLFDSQIDEADRQDAVREASLRFDQLELGVSEWEGRTLVTTNDISATANGASFVIDTNNWCITVDDEFDSERVCLEETLSEILLDLGSDMNPRDFIPEQTGFIVIERNGRWYLDPLGTLGFYADQIAEIGVSLTDELDGSPASEFGEFFVAEGPIARLGAPANRQAEAGSVGIALDLSGYPTVGDDFAEYHVAIARVVTDQPGTFVSYDDVPLTGEDWVAVYDSIEPDLEIPAIAANTAGSLDVELFEVQVTEVGSDGFSGQLGGQGRPQIFTFTDDARSYDISIEGASSDTVFGYESNGVVLNRSSGSFVGNGPFTVVYGDPGAAFTIALTRFEEPEPELEPEPTPEPTPDFDPIPSGGIDDTLVLLFAGIVEPQGFPFSESQPGGFFDGCGGPDDPDVESFLFDRGDGPLLIITPFPSTARAEDSFADLLNVATPCEAFSEIEVNEVVAIGDNDIRIEWQFIDDPASATYEQYRLSGDTIVAATSDSLVELDDLLAILDIWG